MSVHAIWKRRVEAAIEGEAKRLERIAKRLALVYKGEARVGKMPHWSTYKRREAPSGFTLPFGVKHMMRPSSMAHVAPTTLCGWHQASFQSASAYKLPRHELIPAPAVVKAFLGLASAMITCAECWDVVEDLATWIEIGHDAGPRDDLTHLRWSTASGAINVPACGHEQPVPLLSVEEFADHLANRPSDGLNTCAVCICIFRRIHGADRPENAYTSFTTNEEARKR